MLYFIEFIAFIGPLGVPELIILSPVILILILIALKNKQKYRDRTYQAAEKLKKRNLSDPESSELTEENLTPPKPKTSFKVTDLASFWIRLPAFLLDQFIFFFFIFLPLVALYTALEPILLSTFYPYQSSLPSYYEASIPILVFLIMPFIYESFFLVKFGATPGKLLLRLRVTNEYHSNPTLLQAILRTFGYFLSRFAFLGYIWIIFTRRGWHDYLASTYVIRVEDNSSSGKDTKSHLVP